MKRFSITTFLSFTAFVLAVIVPLKASAANFSCSDKVLLVNAGNNAELTINKVGTYDFSDVSIDLVPPSTASNPSPSLVPPASSQAGNTSTQAVYDYTDLLPGNTYRVFVFNYQNKFVEEISNCDFTFPSTTSPSTNTPSNTPTTPVANTQTPLVVPFLSNGATPAAAVGSTSLTTNNSGIVSPDGDGLIPCDGTDCTVNSVIQLIDNIMNFFFKTLLLPIFVVMIMYLGVSYLTAEGKPGQHAKVLSMAKHMVLGLLLILCAWLIVHTILSVLGYTDTFGFFGTPQ